MLSGEIALKNIHYYYNLKVIIREDDAIKMPFGGLFEWTMHTVYKVIKNSKC